MVKSNICPVCLADIPGEYIEEGDLRISDEAITCPNCGFTLQGVVDECPELEEFDKRKRVTKQKPIHGGLMKIISIDLPWQEETRGRRTLAIADPDGKIEIERASDDKELLTLVSRSAEPGSIVLLDVPVEGCQNLGDVKGKHFRPVDMALTHQGISILPSYRAGDRGRKLKERLKRKIEGITVYEIYPYAVYKFLAYLKDNNALESINGDRFDTLLKDGFGTYWPPKYKREAKKGKHLKNMKYIYSLLMDTLVALDFRISLQSPKSSSNLGQMSDEYDACLGVIVGIYFTEKSNYACVVGDSKSGNILLLADQWLSEQLGREVKVANLNKRV